MTRDKAYTSKTQNVRGISAFMVLGLMLAIVTLALCGCGGASSEASEIDPPDRGPGVVGVGSGNGTTSQNSNTAGGALTCGGEIDSENPFPCCNNSAEDWKADSVAGNRGLSDEDIEALASYAASLN